MAKVSITNKAVQKWKEIIPLPDDEKGNSRTLYKDKNDEYVFIIKSKKEGVSMMGDAHLMEIYNIQPV